MSYGFVRWYGLDVAALFQFAVMMLAVAAVLDIVQVIAGLLTQQAQALGTRDMELLLTVRLVALHTSAHSSPMRFAQVLANVTI